MYYGLKSICLFLLWSIPFASFAYMYEAEMHIPTEQQQWFTDLMQSNIIIDSDVYRGMPLGIIEGPTFENGVSVLFMVIKSEMPEVFNILAAPTFKEGKAYGSGIDMDDRENFWLYNNLLFEAHGDTYKIILE